MILTIIRKTPLLLHSFPEQIKSEKNLHDGATNVSGIFFYCEINKFLAQMIYGMIRVLVCRPINKIKIF